MIRWEEKSIIQAAKEKNINLQLMDAKEFIFDLDEPNSFPHVVLQRCVSYFRNLHSTAILESFGSKVVNSFYVNWITGNKLFTTLLLKKNKIKTPKTMLSFEMDSALKALDKLGYPSVIKPIIGSWGRLVALIKDRDSAKALLEDRMHMFPLYQVFYLQELVKRPPRDIRCFVIGDRVVAAIYRISGSDWRTNTALGGKAVNCPITKELEEIASEIVKLLGEGFYGIDCMESKEGLLVHEVNNTTEFRNTVPATGINIPGLVVDYLKKLAKC